MLLKDGTRVEVFTDRRSGIIIGMNIQRSEINRKLWGEKFVALDLTLDQAKDLRTKLNEIVNRFDGIRAASCL